MKRHEHNLSMLKRTALLLVGICSLYAAEDDPAFKVVTKKISLGRYVPQDLGTFMGKRMSQRIIPDLKRLVDAAKKDGLELKPISGYRSYEYQEALFNRYIRSQMKKNPQLTRQQAQEKANTFSAKPGHSEHQLGTVVDVLSKENNFEFSSDPTLSYVGWLEKNASKYNFTISYPKDSKEYIYEPWHLRWYPAKKRAYLPTQNSLKTVSRPASEIDLPVSSLKVVKVS